jgi:hypothetical protein
MKGEAESEVHSQQSRTQERFPWAEQGSRIRSHIARTVSESPGGHPGPFSARCIAAVSSEPQGALEAWILGLTQICHSLPVSETQGSHAGSTKGCRGRPSGPSPCQDQVHSSKEQGSGKALLSFPEVPTGACPHGQPLAPISTLGLREAGRPGC